MIIRSKLFCDMLISLEKSVAVYELLHAHARGETDLTEVQLGNVVTGVAIEARGVVRDAIGSARGRPVAGLVGWVDEAQMQAMLNGA